MKRRAMISGCAVLMGTVVIGVLLTLGLPQQTAGPARPISTEVRQANDLAHLVTLMGASSELGEPLFARCDSAAAWTALWEKHSPGTSIPTINFDKCTVVGLFLGKKHNSKGVVVTSVESRDGNCVLRFDEQTYQTVGGATACTPFGIVVLSKTNLPIVVEENVQNLKDNPPKWKERARITH